MGLLFEWDPIKGERNLIKHAVSVSEACSVFSDTSSRTILDPLHSEDEDRFIIVGHSMLNRLLVVVHTERGERIRLISARQATRKERSDYEKNAK